MFPQSALIAFLLPLGLWLTLVASAHRNLEPRAAAAGLVALAVSALVYLAVGFGLMFGGVGALGNQGQYAELSAFFALPVDGSVWAIAGMKGFFLDEVTNGKTLFIAWLPLAQACATLVAVPLWRRYSLPAVASAAALSTLAFSVIGMTTWGGGLGASIATQLRLGHGPVDFGGLGIGGMIAGTFALMVTRRRGAETLALPESPHPLRAAFGIGLAALGAASHLAANPLNALPQTAVVDYMIAIVVASGVACLSSLAYSVFVSKRPSIETVTASMLAALVAVSAGAMSLPLWAAALLGLISAISVIVGGFLWMGNIDGANLSPGVPRILLPAAAGLLVAGIAASGAYGVGLNGVGAETYLGTPGQGVSGLIGVAGGIGDPGQATAQIVIILLCGAVAALASLPLRLFNVSKAEIEAASEFTQEATIEASLPASALGVPLDVLGGYPSADAAPPVPSVTSQPVPVFAAAPDPILAPAAPVTLPAQLATPPKRAPSATAPTTATRAPAPDPARRTPSLLERLRGNRPTEQPKPAGQARRVAYPVRVGGRRLILRAMPPENKPPEEAKDTDQP